MVDFTFDPDIAVKFATLNPPANAGHASVFAINVSGKLADQVAVLLPPPMTERLYSQRGLFVPVGSAADLERLNVLEVRFPVADYNGEFEVMRKDGPLDIYPGESNLAPVKSLVEQLLAEAEPDNDGFVALAQSLKSSMSQELRNPDVQWAKFTDLFEDALYSLVYDLRTRGMMQINEHGMRRLVHDNLETCCSVANIYRTLGQRYPGAHAEEQLAFLKQISDVIDDFAEEKGYDHRVEGREYAKSVLQLNNIEVH